MAGIAAQSKPFRGGGSFRASEPSPCFTRSRCQTVCGQISAIATAATMANSGPCRMPLKLRASQTSGISHETRDGRQRTGQHHDVEDAERRRRRCPRAWSGPSACARGSLVASTFEPTIRCQMRIISRPCGLTKGVSKQAMTIATSRNAVRQFLIGVVRSQVGGREAEDSNSEP